MSGESSRQARDVTLSGNVQQEMENVIRANTATMNEEQLRVHILEVTKGLEALANLPTTSRLNELLREKQSVKTAEA